MAIVTLLGLAAGLALDAFAVAFAAGSVLPRLTARHCFRLSFHFGLFQGLMPVLGWLAGSAAAALVQSFEHWIACGLLVPIGGRMLLKPAEKETGAECGDPTRGPTLRQSRCRPPGSARSSATDSSATVPSRKNTLGASTT